MRLAAAITTPVTNAAMQVNSSISLRTRAMATPRGSSEDRSTLTPGNRTRNPTTWFHKVPTGRAPESLSRPSKPFHISPLGIVATGGRFRASSACDEGERLAGDMSGSGQHDQAPIEWPAATRGESRCGVEVGRSLRFSRAG
jgi:hypothetical protein